MTLKEYHAWLEKAFTQPVKNPVVKIVPLEEGEEGYHEFKMLDTSGRIVGYCGQAYLDALEKYFDGNQSHQN